MIKVLTFAVMAASVMAQMTAPMKNYNVTSPVSNGPYVAGQVLPCTYVLFSEVDSSSLQLQIVLQPANASTSTPSNDTMVIAPNADVSKTDGSAKHNGNVTYYEHSINYNIPKTVTPGNYQVAFKDLSTNTALDVPIEIRPPSAATPTSSSTPTNAGSDKSIFAAAPSMHHQTTNALWALAVVAGVAIML